MNKWLYQRLLEAVIATDPSNKLLRWIRNHLIMKLDERLNDRREFNRNRFTQWIRSIKMWIPIALFCSFWFVVGIEYNHYTLQQTLWEYRQIKYELFQKSHYNVELQQQLTSIINKKDYLRYKVFESSGVLIPRHVPTDHIKLMLSESKRYNIPSDIYFRLIEKESRYVSTAKSHKNAQGYMQIMPDTYKQFAKRLNIKSSTPSDNIKVGSFILADLHKFWSNKNKANAWKLTIASYNAGLGAVTRHNGVPNFPETQQYVNYILSQQ